MNWGGQQKIGISPKHLEHSAELWSKYTFTVLHMESYHWDRNIISNVTI